MINLEDLNIDSISPSKLSPYTPEGTTIKNANLLIGCKDSKDGILRTRINSVILGPVKIDPKGVSQRLNLQHIEGFENITPEGVEEINKLVDSYLEKLKAMDSRLEDIVSAKWEGNLDQYCNNPGKKNKIIYKSKMGGKECSYLTVLGSDNGTKYVDKTTKSAIHYSQLQHHSMFADIVIRIPCIKLYANGMRFHTVLESCYIYSLEGASSIEELTRNESTSSKIINIEDITKLKEHINSIMSKPIVNRAKTIEPSDDEEPKPIKTRVLATKKVEPRSEGGRSNTKSNTRVVVTNDGDNRRSNSKSIKSSNRTNSTKRNSNDFRENDDDDDLEGSKSRKNNKNDVDEDYSE